MSAPSVGSSWRRYAALTLCAVASVLLLGGGLAAWVGFSYWKRAAAVDLRVVTDMPRASLLLDRKGRVIHRRFVENRILIPEGTVPKRLREAIVATEDRRFYHHAGIDGWAILRAVYANVVADDALQGASTVTQQLARNSIGRLDRTIDRKILEIFLAWRIERAFSKDDILLHYLNRIYFGAGCYGVETAARAYFGRSVQELDLAECALLAGIISSPNRFSPWADAQKALDSRERALNRMVKAGFITESEQARAAAQPLVLVPMPQEERSYSSQAVEAELQRIMPQHDWASDGLEILTTLDLPLQRRAEQIVARGLELLESDAAFRRTRAGSDQAAEPLQAAALALDPATGGILALVGGRDYDVSPFNRAMQSRRDPGTALAPALFALAFEDGGLHPGSWLDAGAAAPGRPDLPRRAVEVLASGSPPAHIALGERVSPERLLNALQRLGVRGPLSADPLLLEGAKGLRLTELLSLHACLAHAGQATEPHLISRIRASDGTILFERRSEPVPVFSPATAAQAIAALEFATSHGPVGDLPRRQGLTVPHVLHWGRSPARTDHWLCGATPGVAIGVWMGFDQPRRLDPQDQTAAAGAGIWTSLTKAVLDIDPSRAGRLFNRPDGLTNFSVATSHGEFFVPLEASDSVDARGSVGWLSELQSPDRW